jgi:hypothetical protein
MTFADSVNKQTLIKIYSANKTLGTQEENFFQLPEQFRVAHGPQNTIHKLPSKIYIKNSL